MRYFKKPLKWVERHKWFAWYPVIVWDGDVMGWAWLEYVWRQRWNTWGSLTKWKHTVVVDFKTLKKSS